MLQCNAVATRTLWDMYGPLMDAKALCKVFYFPSNDALQIAKSRGKLPFRPVSVPGRPGIFALTKEVEKLLGQLEELHPS